MSTVIIAADERNPYHRPRYETDNSDYTNFIIGFRSITEAKKNSILRSLKICEELRKKYGVYSKIQMAAAGLEYTGVGDRARCNECHIELSGWTLDIKPFNRHAQASPKCPLVRAILSKDSIISLPHATRSDTDSFESMGKDQPVFSEETVPLNPLVESDVMTKARKRTFCHWPLAAIPSSTELMNAGFLSCNVGDRVICLYCNLICQQWAAHGDDPYQVHKALSPKCPFVMARDKVTQSSSIVILNERANNQNAQHTQANQFFEYQGLVAAAACQPMYAEMPRREQSFSSWPKENAPPVDALVRAGFFYSGTKTIVTCFYCNGSLQNWGANDNPMIEHARWFPNCAYAKQLCGPDLYRRIQVSKRAQQGS